MYIIHHERYGERTEFATLAEAQATIRACGDDFSATVLSEYDGLIRDEGGDVVGHIDV